MKFIQSTSTDPTFNLALEQYVFDILSPQDDFCMLWQNANTIVVGKHQNTFAEINAAYVDAHDIQVVRRLSGGGAVYHDLGNLNFTFISKTGAEGTFDFATFCQPIVNVLKEMGVQAQVSGRNDMTIDGQKFSGNSQYMKQGRVMHHGTILYDSDLSVVQNALNVPKDKLVSKGITSVRSRVTNVRSHMKNPVSTADFCTALTAHLFQTYALQQYVLTPEDIAQIRQIQKSRYQTWDWNYGQSPAFAIVKERRIEGCGKVEVCMDAVDGIISAVAFYGDFFAINDPSELSEILIGCKLESSALKSALKNVTIGQYFAHMNQEIFIDILLK